MTVGAQWAVYAQGTKQVTPQTPRLGLVEITQVGAITSEAKILAETHVGAIQPNTRAVEVAHNYGEMRLRVEIHASDVSHAAVSALATLIAHSSLLRRAESPQDADVRAYLIGPRTRVEANHPIPQLGAVSQAVWAVVGSDGRLMMPLHAIAEPGAAFTVCENLEKAVRYRHTLGLCNPNPDGLLQGQVGFLLLRQGLDGVWVPAAPDETSGQVVFITGDRIALEISNYHRAPIYVSVLDLGLTGAISQLYPIAGAAEQLVPGRSIRVGVRVGDELELYLPNNFFFAPDPTDLTPTGGTETFKLIATTHAADFSPLIQGGYRGPGAERGADMQTPLGQLLVLALTGHGTRDARRNRLATDEEWTTVERSFYLRQRSL